MPKPLPRTYAPPRPIRKPFAFTAETRAELALVLHRPLRNPERSRAVIDALERRAGQFLEAAPWSIRNSDAAVRDALRRLLGEIDRCRDAMRSLPPRARDALLEWVPRDEQAGHIVTPARLQKDLGVLRTAALAALSTGDLAVNRNGGRPPDRRGHRFAADLALILSDVGIKPTLNAHGQLAKVVETVFAAIERRTGDMGTLLAGVKQILAGEPPKTF